jgi:hypothetical protein
LAGNGVRAGSLRVTYPPSSPTSSADSDFEGEEANVIGVHEEARGGEEVARVGMGDEGTEEERVRPGVEG